MPAEQLLPRFSAVTRALPRRTLCKRQTILQSQVPSSSQARCFSTSTARLEEMSTDRVETPRWQSTPARMIAPVRSRPKPAENEFRVNEDPQRLDQVYKQILGSGGEKVLTEDVKWLAVTHKSYDHGRRGFNDRLAFLGMPLIARQVAKVERESNQLTGRVDVGKRLVDLQTTLALVHAAPSPLSSQATDQYGRVPFQHPALGGLQNVTLQAKARMGDKRRISQLAQQYGLASVVRWKPRKASNLISSGMEVVLAQALYAIVGAVALQRGGESAVAVVRERILQPLGLS